MGMDVCGLQPTAEAGDYFRASIWQWRAIHDLIGRLCFDLLDAETLSALGRNEGAGPADSRTCEAMANRFAAWLAEHPEGHAVDFGVWQTPDGRLLTRTELGRRDRNSFVPAYRVDAEELREWIQFLRHCGGFEVW